MSNAVESCIEEHAINERLASAILEKGCQNMFKRRKAHFPSSHAHQLVRYSIPREKAAKNCLTRIKFICVEIYLFLDRTEVLRNLENITVLDNLMNKGQGNGAFYNIKSTEAETISRLLEYAVKDVQRDGILKNAHSVHEQNAIIINGSLSEISLKFTLNEKQDIAFRIAGSYLLDSFKRSLLQLIRESHFECIHLERVVLQNHGSSNFPHE